MSKINQIKCGLMPLLFLMFNATGFALGPTSDGIYTIRSAVLASAGGRTSEISSGGQYTMNGTLGQPSAVGISLEPSIPYWKLYGGYQLPLVLTNVDFLVTYPATPADMELWWEKVPWATGYRLYGNFMDPYIGPYVVFGETAQTQYFHTGIINVMPKYFYQVRALRPWVAP